MSSAREGETWLGFCSKDQLARAKLFKLFFKKNRSGKNNNNNLFIKKLQNNKITLVIWVDPN